VEGVGATEATSGTVLGKARSREKHGRGALHSLQQKVLNLLPDGFDEKSTTVKRAKIAKCFHDTALRDAQLAGDRGERLPLLKNNRLLEVLTCPGRYFCFESSWPRPAM
jgi:hypothetical protein